MGAPHILDIVLMRSVDLLNDSVMMDEPSSGHNPLLPKAEIGVQTSWNIPSKGLTGKVTVEGWINCQKYKRFTLRKN